MPGLPEIRSRRIHGETSSENSKRNVVRVGDAPGFLLVHGLAVGLPEIDDLLRGHIEPPAGLSILVESSHHSWALNLDGKAVYPSSREEAEKILQSAPENTDIGLMQVNFRIWGANLGVTKEQLLDPFLNVWAGAVIFRHYLLRYPFWKTVGRYHSGEKDRQIWYAWRAYRTLYTAGNPR